MEFSPTSSPYPAQTAARAGFGDELDVRSENILMVENAYHMVFHERWGFLPRAHRFLPRAAVAARAGFGDEWEKTHLSWKTM